MGLRAFSSQLLCEQVVGRGLRRTSYEVNERGFFEPEYVNIFGVPFTFLPHESTSGPPRPPKPKTPIEPLAEKARFEIRFPVVIRVERVYRPDLFLDWDAVAPLTLDPVNTPTLAELAKTLDAKTDRADVRIDLEKFWGNRRLQQIAFEAAAQLYDQMKPGWPDNREVLCARLVTLTQDFLASDRIVIKGLWNQDPLRRRILIGMNMTRIVQHFWRAIESANTEQLTPVFDPERPIRSTGDMGVWYTGKPVGPARRSHINFCVYDGTFEPEAATELDNNPDVEAWAKNDHLGLRDFLRPPGRGAPLPARLPDPPPVGRNPGAGGQRRPQGDRRIQMGLHAGLDQSRKHPRRLRPLVLRRPDPRNRPPPPPVRTQLTTPDNQQPRAPMNPDVPPGRTSGGVPPLVDRLPPALADARPDLL